VVVITQRRRAACLRNRHAHRGIEAQRVGVILITPAQAEQHQHGAQQFREAVGHLVLRTRVGEAGNHPRDDAAALQQLAQQYCAAIRTQPLGTCLDDKAAVEGWHQNRQCFTQRVLFLFRRNPG
jgi:hypothetical protein